jgi:hypothetical protein
MDPDETIFSLDESENIDHAGPGSIMDVPESNAIPEESLDNEFVIDKEQDNTPVSGISQERTASPLIIHTDDGGDNTRMPPAAHPSQKKKMPLFYKIAVPAALLLIIVILSALFLTKNFFPGSLHRADDAGSGAVNKENNLTVAPLPGPEDTYPGNEAVQGAVNTPEDSKPVQPEGSEMKNYYVIAGCFGQLQNAENYVTQLKQNGYDASLVGVRKNLNVVSFGVFGNKQEALRFMKQVRKEFEPEAWVLYYDNH